MSFYADKMRANKKIDELIEGVVIANKQVVNIKKIILELTRNLPVSEKAIMQRIKMHTETNLDLTIKGDELFLEE